MRIEIDRAKDKANHAKHEVSLALAAELDWKATLVWIDERFEYDELRMIALAPKSAILTTWPLLNVARFEGQSAYAAPIVER